MADPQNNLDQKRRSSRNIALASAAGAALMVGAAFASVPLYRIFCQVTGYGGTTQTADQAPTEVLDRVITIYFDGNTSRDMPWDFKPSQRKVIVKVGEVGLAFYEAHNLSSEVVTGTATFNVTPFKAGVYFTKVDCFCFTEQKLKPGERTDMPVTFYVDPEIADDPTLDDVKEITLSYTFFPLEGDETEQVTMVSGVTGESQTPAPN